YQNRPTHPITIELADIVKHFNIPEEYFEELIAGVEMDLKKQRYATFDELYQYCYRVASIVGLICIEIFGYTQRVTKDYAVTLGVALQLINILRDLKADAGQGRIYIPQEDLERFHYSERDLLSATYNAAFINLMEFEALRAKEYFQRARTMLPKEDRKSLFAAEIMGSIYYELLKKIEHYRYNVFEGDMTLSNSRKLLIALKVWLKYQF
ncbi:MAG: squalene/phytoene synthase family protein, partial [Candidatus Tectomicrobia bacterium]|nr:squalene/phytoene synthase family protein [Candidatus Tectomicrobia bacterium]